MIVLLECGAVNLLAGADRRRAANSSAPAPDILEE